MELHFSKYEGAGNDFITVDGRTALFDPPRETVRALCDRHYGIGADGLMILGSDPEAEFSMRYFNADGGESTLCGNGGRCITLFAEHLGIGGREKRFRAADGIHTAELLSTDQQEGGMVGLQMADVKEVLQDGSLFFLDTGSPHYVEFVEDVDGVDVAALGREIRHSADFAAIRGTNVNFVQITGDGLIRVRTYERGVEGETLACGTGVTAAALATHIYRQSHRMRFRATVPGGELEVSFFTPGDGSFTGIRLTGPAKKTFSGVIRPDFLIRG